MPAAIDWTPELEQAIVDWIANGQTLRSFCRKDGNPSHDAVYDHEKLSESFKQRIAHAREVGHDAIADECLEIADGSLDANIGKLRVWTRLELLKKWNPRKYGEKSQVALTDADGNALTIKHIGSDGE